MFNLQLQIRALESVVAELEERLQRARQELTAPREARADRVLAPPTPQAPSHFKLRPQSADGDQ